MHFPRKGVVSQDEGHQITKTAGHKGRAHSLPSLSHLASKKALHSQSNNTVQELFKCLLHIKLPDDPFPQARDARVSHEPNSKHKHCTSAEAQVVGTCSKAWAQGSRAQAPGHRFQVLTVGGGVDLLRQSLNVHFKALLDLRNKRRNSEESIKRGGHQM